MRITNLLVSALVGMAAWTLLSSPARAGTVLYDSAGFIQGQQSFAQSFDITTAGTITVTLSNISWLDTISNLNVFMSTSSGLIGSTMGVGTETLNVQPGELYAHWFGDASGSNNLGVYGLEITYQPNCTTPVPLPLSFILLLSGLGLLLGWQRRPAATADAARAPEAASA